MDYSSFLMRVGFRLCHFSNPSFRSWKVIYRDNSASILKQNVTAYYSHGSTVSALSLEIRSVYDRRELYSQYFCKAKNVNIRRKKGK